MHIQEATQEAARRMPSGTLSSQTNLVQEKQVDQELKH